MQVAMVMDLNKCIGCQTCTTACKSLWTDEPGQEYMLWNNVETKPGPGYPRYWEEGGGGYDAAGNLKRDGLMPAKEDHGEEIPLNHDEVYFKGVEVRLQQEKPMGKGANWDEDTSSGDYPNNYHFYVPRMCNHCTKPSCLEACPVRAIYKREEDGVVLIDQDKCQGIRECNKACPYDKIYFNYVTGKSQKCIFCFPRLEEGVAPACARQCPGRLRFVGYLEVKMVLSTNWFINGKLPCHCILNTVQNPTFFMFHPFFLPLLMKMVSFLTNLECQQNIYAACLVMKWMQP